MFYWENPIIFKYNFFPQCLFNASVLLLTHKRPIKPKLHLNIPHMKSRTLSRRFINFTKEQA